MISGCCCFSASLQALEHRSFLNPDLNNKSMTVNLSVSVSIHLHFKFSLVRALLIFSASASAHTPRSSMLLPGTRIGKKKEVVTSLLKIDYSWIRTAVIAFKIQLWQGRVDHQSFGECSSSIIWYFGISRSVMSWLMRFKVCCCNKLLRSRNFKVVLTLSNSAMARAPSELISPSGRFTHS